MRCLGRLNMTVKITVEEIRKLLDIETPEFPKYVAPLSGGLSLEIWCSNFPGF